MFLMADLESTQKITTICTFLVKNIIFWVSYAEKSIFGRKHTSAVPEQHNRFRDKPTIPQKNSCSKVPTVFRNLVFFFDPMCPTPFVSRIFVLR